MKFAEYISLLIESAIDKEDELPPHVPNKIKGIIPQKDLERMLGGRKIGDSVKSFPIGDFGIMTRMDNPGLWILKPPAKSK